MTQMCKPAFLTPEPIVQFCNDDRDCVLLTEIRFRDSNCRTWIAHKDKVTDGASIPQCLWFLIGGPYEGHHRDGALCHDDAYGDAPAAQQSLWLATFSHDRACADRMMYQASRTKGTPWWKAALIYLGLRFGGGLAWQGHAKENAAKVA